MIERIRQLMEYKEFTSTQFADAIEIPRATMSHLLSERNKPSLDVIVKILSAFRDIDPNWLLLGEGEMKLSVASAAQQASSPAPEPGQLKQPEPQRHAAPVPVFSSTAKQVEQIVILYKDKNSLFSKEITEFQFDILTKFKNGLSLDAVIEDSNIENQQDFLEIFHIIVTTKIISRVY